MNNFIVREYYNSYIKDLANIEKETYLECRKIMGLVNDKIKESWECCQSYNEIFDFTTGAIKFYDYEWELTEDNKIKKLFSEKYDEISYKYLMETDFEKLLRGSNCYYVLPCEKQLYKPVGRTLILKWINNLQEFLFKALECVDELCVSNDINKKFLLAICDHIRLYYTINLDFALMRENNGSNFVYYNNDKKNKIYELTSNLSSLLSVINKILFENYCDIEFIKKMLVSINKEQKIILEQIRKSDISVLNQSFKTHRELDCYLENLVGVSYGLSQINACKDYRFIGVMNGGVELPVIACIILNRSLDNIVFININSKFLYLERHNEKNDFGNMVMNCKIEDIEPFILMDDNSLTGMTLERCFRLSSNPYRNLAILMRHPNINRAEQSKIYNKVVDLSKYKKVLFGMLFDSPFTRLKPNTNYGNEYLDELGIFTKAGHSFLEYLYKNQYFKRNTDVSNVKGILNRNEIIKKSSQD